MTCICVCIYTHNIWNVYGGRKGLSSSLLWRFRDRARGVWRRGVNGAVAWCGAAAARELVRVKDELCWYKSARFWQFAATAAAYGQEVDFDLRVDHVGRLQWRHPITSSAQFVCHIYTEFMARSHLSFVSAIVYRKHTHTIASRSQHTHTHTHTHIHSHIMITETIAHWHLHLRTVHGHFKSPTQRNGRRQ